jgi:hypothetical protein
MSIPTKSCNTFGLLTELLPLDKRTFQYSVARTHTRWTQTSFTKRRENWLPITKIVNTVSFQDGVVGDVSENVNGRSRGETGEREIVVSRCVCGPRQWMRSGLTDVLRR